MAFFLAASLFNGCGKKKTDSLLTDKEMKNLQEKISSLQEKGIQTTRKLNDLRDNLQIQKTEIEELKLQIRKLEREKTRQNNANKQLLEELGKLNQIIKRQAEDYEILLEKMDELKEYQEEYQKVLDEHENIFREIKDELNTREKTLENAAADKQNRDEEISEDEVISDGNIQGTVRRGKISGLKGGYKTY
ncbi:hypothetical protein ACFLQ1_02245 [Candidatus Auribacterota bacterium]